MAWEEFSHSLGQSLTSRPTFSSQPGGIARRGGINIY
jgi:hypothetical protein